MELAYLNCLNNVTLGKLLVRGQQPIVRIQHLHFIETVVADANHNDGQGKGRCLKEKMDGFFEGNADFDNFLLGLVKVGDGPVRDNQQHTILGSIFGQCRGTSCSQPNCGRKIGGAAMRKWMLQYFLTDSNAPEFHPGLGNAVCIQNTVNTFAARVIRLQVLKMKL